MGFRDRIQAKMSKHGGVVGLAKAAVRKAGGGGSETSDTTSASKTQALGPLPKAPASDGFIAVGHSAKLSTYTNPRPFTPHHTRSHTPKSSPLVLVLPPEPQRLMNWV